MRRFASSGFIFVLLIFLQLLTAHSDYVVRAQATPRYYLQISSMEYPSEVPINLTFRINVVINYSLPMLSDYSTFKWFITARLYNSTQSEQGPSTQTLLATSEVEETSGNGTHTFGLIMRAPTYPTIIHFTVYAMYQSIPPFIGSNPPSGPRADDWSYTHAPGSNLQISIDVVQNAPLYFSTNRLQMPVTVDGYQQLETDDSGHLVLNLAVLHWHFIAIPPIVNYGNGTRAVLVSWQDGTNSTMRSFFLRSATCLNATYKTQYLLTVNGNEGSGWYDDGSNVKLGAVPEKQANGVLGLFGFKEVFSGWSGDVQSKTGTITIPMNGPHQIIADWEIRYRPNGAKIMLPLISLLLLIVLSFSVLNKRRKGHHEDSK